MNACLYLTVFACISFALKADNVVDEKQGLTKEQEERLIKTHNEFFTKMDSDENGHITKEEMSVFLKNQEKEFKLDKKNNEEHFKQVTEIFERADRDLDGVITHKEFTTQHQHDEL